MKIEEREKEIILKKLQAPASKESLFDFISWLDKECEKAGYDLTSSPYQILARSTIALGYILPEEIRFEPVRQTLKAGEAFALNPTEESWTEFSVSATNSYPFGPGDGCFSIVELEDTGGNPSCKPGTGCWSGAGNLGCQAIDEAEVMKAIAGELTPWILETGDPVLTRSEIK